MLGDSVATGNIVKNVTCTKQLLVRFTTVILRSFRVHRSETICVAKTFAAYRITNYYLEVSIVHRMFTNQMTQRSGVIHVD